MYFFYDNYIFRHFGKRSKHNWEKLVKYLFSHEKLRTTENCRYIFSFILNKIFLDVFYAWFNLHWLNRTARNSMQELQNEKFFHTVGFESSTFCITRSHIQNWLKFNHIFPFFPVPRSPLLYVYVNNLYAYFVHNCYYVICRNTLFVLLFFFFFHTCIIILHITFYSSFYMIQIKWHFCKSELYI